MLDYNKRIEESFNQIPSHKQKQIVESMESYANGTYNTTNENMFNINLSNSNNSNIDYSLESGNNILEPLANLIFKAIVTVFPSFDKHNK